jgi:hypothetical protein
MRIAKVMFYDGATDLCLVRCEAGEYWIVEGPIVQGTRPSTLSNGDSNYTSARIAYENKVSDWRRSRL